MARVEMCERGAARSREDGQSPSAAVEPDDVDHLHQMVAEVLSRRYGTAPQVDDDHDYCLAHLDQPARVRVRSKDPAVVILARVAHDVRSRRRAAVELSLLNRDHAWVRWTLVGDSVWQSIVIPALPFAPAHLEDMLDVFGQTLAETRDDLAFRLGAAAA